MRMFRKVPLCARTCFVVCCLGVGLLLAACFSGRDEPETQPTATVQEIAAEPTATPLPPTPVSASTPASASTPVPPTCLVLAQALNLRTGPGPAFDAFAVLSANTSVEPQAVDPTGVWVLVQPPDESSGWVNSAPQFIDCNINLATLPLNAGPPTPTNTAVAANPPTPIPTPTEAALANVPRAGGSDGNMVGNVYTTADLFTGPPDFPTFSTEMYFRIIACDLADDRCRPDGGGEPDGAGIREVGVTIRRADEDGNEDGDSPILFQGTEESHAYCSFGGDDPCPSIDVRPGARWPGTGLPIESGAYSLSFAVNSNISSENDGFWRIVFRIQQPGQTTTGFSGTWLTNLGSVSLTQTGSAVSGTYQLYGDSTRYSLEGTAADQILTGTYTGFDGGTIRFELSPDGQSFDGSWFYQGQGVANHWCGVRSGALRPGCGFSGAWESIGDYTPNYPPTIELRQTGDQIEGTFLNGVAQEAGSITGRVGTEGVGSQLRAVGRWSVAGFAGDFRWQLLDANSVQFRGRSVTADGVSHQWCGWRSGLAQPDPCFE